MAEEVIQLNNGDTVIQDRDRRNVVINIDDLYKYRFVDTTSDVTEGTGKVIPNEGDMIYSLAAGLFHVSRVDYTSYVADLKLWELPKSANEVGVDDVFLGTGPGYSDEIYRAYVDTRVFPFRLQISSFLGVRGSENKEVRVFRGINTGVTGEVVSAYYNQSGDYISDAIPLEVVDTEEGNNIANKAAVMGYTSKNLNNGELLTAVIYNQLGMVTGIAKMLVHRTNVIRRPSDQMKRVQAIEIISPFLSSSEPNTLDVPMNVTVATLAMRAKVTYTDGTSSTLDVGDETSNSKFKILGLKYWSPSVGGSTQELTLTYNLSENEEYSYLQGETANGRVTENYFIRALPVDATYSLKLYAFPVWKDTQTGYQLEYWLYDLNRAVARRVPKAAVELDVTSAAFDGKDYTSIQHLKFGVQLSVVDPEFGNHRHTQAMQIALIRDGSIRASNWKARFSGNQINWFGDGLEAPVRAGTAGASIVNLTNGAANLTAWLDKMFYNADPLYDPQTEVKAPQPTHFIVTTKTRTYEVPIGQWNTDITFINDVTEGGCLYLKWIKRIATTDLQLGVTGIPVHGV